MTADNKPGMGRFILPAVVLLASGAAAFWITTQKPVADRGQEPRGTTLSVDAKTLARQPYQIELPSQGLIRPRTESKLVAQVSGAVVEMSEKLREGAFFEAGDLLLSIDDRDYRAELDIAEAGRVEASLKLAEESARSEQAGRDWKSFGQGAASDLVLRKPQLASVQAAQRSAEARVAVARLKLERTQVRAPYAGRVQKKSVDVGQVVSAGTVLADIYAVDALEIRLPLDGRALAQIDLPEPRRGKAVARSNLPKVNIAARHGDATHLWQGRVVRVDGAIDSATRQLSIVVQVDDPYGAGAGNRPPLKIGQFVEARVMGRQLKDVFVLPRKAVRQDDSVLLVEKGRLRVRKINPVWRDAENVVVAEGLQPGELLSLTPLGAGSDGAPVKARVDGVELKANIGGKARSGQPDAKPAH
ncbi:MAG: efflux RND transporter periplasmic adaptor subunit [Sulfuritalea sp.]|nr:efflux RND transporter periplasmic adaptor subunit [Sulfuritalea sp.]